MAINVRRQVQSAFYDFTDSRKIHFLQQAIPHCVALSPYEHYMIDHDFKCEKEV